MGGVKRTLGSIASSVTRWHYHLGKSLLPPLGLFSHQKNEAFTLRSQNSQLRYFPVLLGVPYRENDADSLALRVFEVQR